MKYKLYHPDSYLIPAIPSVHFPFKVAPLRYLFTLLPPLSGLHWPRCASRDSRRTFFPLRFFIIIGIIFICYFCFHICIFFVICCRLLIVSFSIRLKLAKRCEPNTVCTTGELRFIVYSVYATTHTLGKERGNGIKMRKTHLFSSKCI